MTNNCFQNLMDIQSSRYTRDAILTINIKESYAYIKCKNGYYQSLFDEYMSNIAVSSNKPDIIQLIGIISLLGLDTDGDVTNLDEFIKIRDNVVTNGCSYDVNI